MKESGRGIHALDRAELVNLIVLPPYSTRGVPKPVVGAAVAYAETRRAVVILDPPATWATVDDAATGAGYLTSPNAALYFPRLLGPDPLRPGQSRAAAPSGAVAGLLARLDLEKGVWSSPVGTLRGVSPAIAITRSDVERLAPLAVNTIRSLPGRGTTVWGARTRSGDPEWKYVNVRRTLLYLEESIERGLRWAAFEPNAPNLWARVRTDVENFLYATWRQGAFPASRPEDAFFVRCGPDTMTQDDIDQGRLIVLIGIAPIKPAEFVVFRIGQWVGQDP
jgi:hypothetical protein